ncbi:hypothetical protein SAY87_027014 [Trapa incisa]|uniref:Uncharacterized protein n=1 Tax=Trapa incisa TaxID=236973 RepID=A0AAN7H0D4_9MYRT|nr:hypothetical protein SAY87_027014 [Trapa incisa]
MLVRDLSIRSFYGLDSLLFPVFSSSSLDSSGFRAEPIALFGRWCCLVCDLGLLVYWAIRLSRNIRCGTRSWNPSSIELQNYVFPRFSSTNYLSAVPSLVHDPEDGNRNISQILAEQSRLKLLDFKEDLVIDLRSPMDFVMSDELKEISNDRIDKIRAIDHKKISSVHKGSKE